MQLAWAGTQADTQARRQAGTRALHEVAPLTRAYPRRAQPVGCYLPQRGAQQAAEEQGAGEQRDAAQHLRGRRGQGGHRGQRGAAGGASRVLVGCCLPAGTAPWLCSSCLLCLLQLYSPTAPAHQEGAHKAPDLAAQQVRLHPQAQDDRKGQPAAASEKGGGAGLVLLAERRPAQAPCSGGGAAEVRGALQPATPPHVKRNRKTLKTRMSSCAAWEGRGSGLRGVRTSRRSKPRAGRPARHCSARRERARLAKDADVPHDGERARQHDEQNRDVLVQQLHKLPHRSRGGAAERQAAVRRRLRRRQSSAERRCASRVGAVCALPDRSRRSSGASWGRQRGLLRLGEKSRRSAEQAGRLCVCAQQWSSAEIVKVMKRTRGDWVRAPSSWQRRRRRARRDRARSGRRLVGVSASSTRLKCCHMAGSAPSPVRASRAAALSVRPH